MADKDDVKSDTEQTTSTPQQDPPDKDKLRADEVDVHNEPITPRNQGRPIRLLLLLLLLVVLGAVAWYVYVTPEEPASQPAVSQDSTSQRGAIPIPPRNRAENGDRTSRTTESPQKQADKVISQDESIVSAPIKDKGENAEGSIPSEPAREKIPLPTGPQDLSAELQGQDPSDRKRPADKAAVVPENKEDSASLSDKEPDAEAEASEKNGTGGSVAGKGEETGTQETETEGREGDVADRKDVSVATGPYTVQVGAYTRDAHLVADQEKLHELGFGTSVTHATRPMRMLRLRVGTFFPSQGEKQIARLKELGAEPFFVKDGDLMVVYAGSFRNETRARRLSDHLAEQGVHVETERIKADLDLSILRFGPFETYDEASEAAQKARSAGLEALVVKKR